MFFYLENGEGLFPAQLNWCLRPIVCVHSLHVPSEMLSLTLTFLLLLLSL